jgi:prepilin-type N-terminal cleavage/methylation domain-containing protein
MNKKGMTLIEVIVAMAIFGIMSVAVFPAIFLYSRINTISQQIDTASSVSLDVMEDLVRYSDTIRSNALVTTMINQGYTLISPALPETPSTVYVLNRTESPYLIEVTLTMNATNPYQVTVRVVVSAAQGSFTGDRSEVQNVLGFVR